MNTESAGPLSLSLDPTSGPEPVAIAVATPEDREIIYGLRHEVYARELGQHPENAVAQLSDALDAFNIYLAAKIRGQLAGFISITPPQGTGYSIDKYLPRQALPFPFDDRLYEIRLLTVLKSHRGRDLAALLMYAAFRWVESHGGMRIMAIGRREILDLYLKAGLEPVGMAVQSGAVTYEVLQAATAAIRLRAAGYGDLLDRLEPRTEWRLNFPFRRPVSCFHGGAFFAAVGERFDALERHQSIINADVLDAWFPPSPKVIDALENHLPWLLRTSPPTNCQGLIDTISQVRGLASDCVLPGAGSSDLIFRAMRQWLKPSSRTLILDPTYGEYAHVLERVIGCQVDRLPLSRRNGYEVNLAELEAALERAYDLVVLVNPNSPTGRHVRREDLQAVLGKTPIGTRVWIDETYLEYVGAGQSLEQFATKTESIIVCKSMSKVYALSGARAAYLCAAPHQLEELRSITPPWVVSLPGQLAAVRALEDPDYYRARYAETSRLRKDLAGQLGQLGWEVIPGVANFLLGHLPERGPNAAAVVAECQRLGLFLRDASTMGSALGTHAIRVAVKDAETNRCVIRIIAEALACLGRPGFP